MKNKGLSTIVATLIIILLVLVAVGIIWVVVRNVLEGGAGQITSSYDCTTAIVKPTKVICEPNAYPAGNNGTCAITYTRDAGGGEIGGIKLILSDGDQTFIHDVPNDPADPIVELKTKTEVVGSSYVNITRVDVAVYFLDDSGTEQLCNPSGYREVQL